MFQVEFWNGLTGSFETLQGPSFEALQLTLEAAGYDGKPLRVYPSTGWFCDIPIGWVSSKHWSERDSLDVPCLESNDTEDMDTEA